MTVPTALGSDSRFSFLFGSCIAQWRPERIQTLEAMSNTPSNAVFLLGDTAYYKSEDLGDKRRMLNSFARNRSLPAFGRLCSSRPVQAIWDDHDFGNNDADGSAPHSLMAKEVFLGQFPRTTPHDCSPSGGIEFSILLGNTRFLFLDNRSHRDATLPLNPWNGSYLGSRQMSWFRKEVSRRDYDLLVVLGGSQFHSTNLIKETYRRHREFSAFQSALREELDAPVLFLSGDIHMTEVFDLSDQYRNGAWEVTCSGIGNSADSALKFTKQWERHEYLNDTPFTFGKIEIDGNRVAFEHIDSQARVVKRMGLF